MKICDFEHHDMQIRVGTRDIGKATNGVSKHRRLSNLHNECEKNS